MALVDPCNLLDTSQDLDSTALAVARVSTFLTDLMDAQVFHLHFVNKALDALPESTRDYLATVVEDIGERSGLKIVHENAVVPRMIY